MKRDWPFVLVPIVILTTAAEGQDRTAPAIEIQSVTTPPVETIADARSPRDQQVPPVTISVTLLSGRAMLWSGTLRVGMRGVGSSYSQIRSEAPPHCPEDDNRVPIYRRVGERLNVRLDRQNSGKEDTFSINADWSRPLPDCQGEGSSMLGLSRSFDLTPGKSIELQGDAGFTVRLSRKD